MRHWLMVIVILLAGVPWSPPAQARQDAGDDCVSSLTESINRAGLPLKETAEIFGCRRLPNGQWTAATILDRRQFLRVIPEEHETAVAQGRDALREDLRRMLEDRRFTQWFTYNIDTGRLTAPGLTPRNEMDKGNVFRMSLSGEALMKTPPDLVGIRNEYERAGASYLLEPDQVALANYVLWYMNRRDAALLAMTASTNPLAAQGFQSVWGYGRLPWPWQLADTYTISSYLLWQIGTQPQPLAPLPTVPSQSTSSGGGGFEAWLSIRVEDEDGTLLAGACFEVVGPFPYSRHYETSPETWEVCDGEGADAPATPGVVVIPLQSEVGGTYKVRETRAPSGYEIDSRVQVPVMEAGSTLTVTFVHRRAA
ncbi:MAG: prealbumin-like fold domain-containing protein [Chloroflexota bacterium]|nr:prealbumin-like fold domain-containing protein [Chloroflexota bacterium]